MGYPVDGFAIIVTKRFSEMSLTAVSDSMSQATSSKLSVRRPVSSNVVFDTETRKVRLQSIPIPRDSKKCTTLTECSPRRYIKSESSS